MTLPAIDSKTRAVSSAALLLLAFTVGRNSYLELIVCESVLSLMIYCLLRDIVLGIKKESAFKVFQLFLLAYFLRNVVTIFFYYTDQIFFTAYFTWFLIPVIIIPVFIAYFGPEKRFFVSKRIARLLSFALEYRAEISSSEFLYNGNGHGLTEREYEIIKLVSRGYTNKQIAEKLFLSKSSIDHARILINEKLGIRRQSEYIEFLEKYPPTHKKWSKK